MIRIFICLIGLILAFDSTAIAQSRRVISARCGNCQKAVPLNSRVGGKCPYCKVIWGRESSSYTRSRSYVSPSRPSSKRAPSSSSKDSSRKSRKPTSAKCSECQKNISTNSVVGDKCPHCNVKWTRSTTSKSYNSRNAYDSRLSMASFGYGASYGFSGMTFGFSAGKKYPMAWFTGIGYRGASLGARYYFIGKGKPTGQFSPVRFRLETALSSVNYTGNYKRKIHAIHPGVLMGAGLEIGKRKIVNIGLNYVLLNFNSPAPFDNPGELNRMQLSIGLGLSPNESAIIKNY